MITFPEIRAIKGRYGLSDAELGKVIGNTHHTFSKKMRLFYDFSLTDQITLLNYFKSLGEDVTIQELFFDWIFSNEKYSFEKLKELSKQDKPA